MRARKAFQGLLVVGVTLLFAVVAVAQDRAPGEPIPGMDIKLGRKPPGGGTIVAQGTTDAQGNFVFTNLPSDGTYFLRITVAGKPYEIAADSAGQPIRLAATGAATGADATVRGAKPTPGTSKKFTVDLGEITATVEVGAGSIRGSINKARSNIKSTR